jgi:hypothetical protein
MRRAGSRAGNIDVQRELMRLLTLRAEPFLRGIATRIERAQGITAMLPDAGAGAARASLVTSI